MVDFVRTQLWIDENQNNTLTRTCHLVSLLTPTISASRGLLSASTVGWAEKAGSGCASSPGGNGCLRDVRDWCPAAATARRLGTMLPSTQNAPSVVSENWRADASAMEKKLMRGWV